MALLYQDDIREFIIKSRHKSLIYKYLFNLMVTLNDKKVGDDYIREIQHMVKPELSNGEQQDAAELLDGLIECFNKVSS